jgi:3-hexulose-6-phosphate synthase
MRLPKLQLALDFVRLDEAMSIADRAAAHVDIIEAGTPLIKACGLDAVRRLKRRFPHTVIVADMKTMDTGDLEAALAFRAGADAMTVLGVAARETIAGAAAAARRCGRQVVVDSIGVEDLGGLLSKIGGLEVDWLLVHTGIDQQQAGKSPFADLEALHGAPFAARLGVVGGLDAANAAELRHYPRVELVVVGGAITRAGDPGNAARFLRAVLHRPT